MRAATIPCVGAGVSQSFSSSATSSSSSLSPSTSSPSTLTLQRFNRLHTMMAMLQPPIMFRLCMHHLCTISSLLFCYLVINPGTWCSVFTGMCVVLLMLCWISQQQRCELCPSLRWLSFALGCSCSIVSSDVIRMINEDSRAHRKLHYGTESVSERGGVLRRCERLCIPQSGNLLLLLLVCGVVALFASLMPLALWVLLYICCR